MRRGTLILATIVALALPTVASANLLVLTSLAADQQYQQTTNNPCVIGENSCKQPPNFPHTVLAAGSADSYDAFSPGYRVDFLQGFFGNEFQMGFDINQATAGGSGIQQISLFEMRVNGVVVDSITFQPPQQIPPTPGGNNGNGYADYLISNFSSLAGFSAADIVTFHAVLPSVNDGAEQFFILDSPDRPGCPPNCPPPPPPPPPPVPEPGTLALMGAALFGTAFRLRRRRS